MFRRSAATKPRKSELVSLPAPTAGWISNRNLAVPKDGPQGAEVLDNFFPTATSAMLRRGSLLSATLGLGDKDTLSLFTYVSGAVERMFGATEDTIYDITDVPSPNNWYLADDEGEPIITDEGETFGGLSTDGLDVLTGLTGGNWHTVQFATAGGTTYLIGVNGQDAGFVYDGTTFYPHAANGVFLLSYDAGTVDFTAGETVTGGTSGATGTIINVVGSGPGEGVLWLTDIAGGPFEDNEALTDGEGGSALANGANTIVPGTNITFEGNPGLTTADLSYVWTYKRRLFFLEKESLTAWYLPVDQIAGELRRLPLAGVFPRGGSLVFGQTWSLDSGAEGGLSEQCVFVTTEGEVAVYQGNSPDELTWTKTGIYRIGDPLGPKAWTRAGGDLLISTNIGAIPLSQAIQRDVAALAPAAVSYPIEVAWNNAVQQRGGDWHCELWSEGQMVVFAPPVSIEDGPAVFVANARTGAWTRFTGWDIKCMCVFRGQLYFGSTEGRVVQANVTGSDEGRPYTGAYVPLFDDLGSPASLKIAGLARHTLRSAAPVNELVTCQFDFDTNLPSPPDAPIVSAGNQWNVAIWGPAPGAAVWSGRADALMTQNWQSIGGTGYTLAPSLQLTSGAVVPLDAELIRTEMTFQAAAIVT